ncbi:MAG: TIGR02099 family protein [Gammaproteobacteria bacterium]|nr:TIGR02099 family protein [Gammaproteobacteria bacterium]
MERSRRRLWTRLITATAILMVAAAVLSGLFQIAVLAVPGYRQDLAGWVSRLAGRPVRIGTLALTWRGYYPSLDLGQVEIRSPDDRRTVLVLERVRLGLGFTRLVAGDFTPRRLELSGIALRARLDRDGRFHLLGLDEAGGPDADFAEALAQLERFSRVQVLRCTLELRDERRDGETQLYTLTEAALESGLLGREFEAELRLPSALGETLRLDADFTGALPRWETWDGSYRAELRRLAGAGWLRPWLAPGAHVEVEDAVLRSQGRFAAGRLEDAWLSLSARAIRAQRAGHGAELRRLAAWAQLRRQEPGWELTLQRLSAEGAQGSWPEIRGRAGFELADGHPRALDAELSHLPLHDLAPWLAILRTPSWLSDLHDVSGLVRGLRLRWTPGAAPPLAVRAEFDGLRLPAAGRRVGFDGLSGNFAVDETGGRLVLEERPLQLELPDAMSEAVAFDRLSAEAQWRQDEQGWSVVAPRLAFAVAGAEGQAQFELRLPPERSPELKLHAQFAAADATRLKRYMPRRWGEGLRGWLDRAIRAARVPRGELAIEGALHDFPFRDKPGRFALDLEVADAELAFSPDWPAILGLHAQLAFRGNSLTIAGDAGTLAGTSIQAVSARFADFAEARLEIDGRVAGELPQYYEVLRASPLAARFAGLTEHSSGAGPARVDLHLDIPLHDAHKTATRGSVSLDQVELRYGALDEPLRAIRGVLAFDDHGVTAERIGGRFHELELVGRMSAQDGVSTLDADFEFAPKAGGEGASGLVPAWLRRALSGKSRWQARMAFGGAAAGGLLLSSELEGTAIALPAPLNKPAEAVSPLRLRFLTDDKSPLRLAVDYELRLGADLRFAAARGGGLTLARGALRLGPGEPPAAQGPGLVLSGSVPQLDLFAWSAALRGAGLEQQAGALKHAELRANLTLLGDYALRDSALVLDPVPSGWRIQLSGAGAEGELNWRDPGAKAGGPALSARLARLALDHRGLAEEAGAAEGAPLHPGELPTLDLEVGRLTIGKTELGRVAVLTQRIADGQKLLALRAGGGIATLEGSGAWTRAQGKSAAEFDFDLASSDIAGLLRSFGFAPNLDAKQSRVRASLAWTPAAAGVSWTQARGSVDLEFGNGQLRAVEPGAGRVLGLINFYALPRRLSLNFRDVVSKGLGFDRIQGRFQLADGNAMTDKIDIAAPSLRMEMRGRIGLAARDYDQFVRVYPDVSAGVTLGAALLGGPALGAIALVAQEVLNKPLDQATQLFYRLTGSWDNPKLEPVRNGNSG